MKIFSFGAALSSLRQACVFEQSYYSDEFAMHKGTLTLK